MWFTSENGLRYEEMQFITRPYQMVFMAGLFIGSLGAVMDVAYYHVFFDFWVV